MSKPSVSKLQVMVECLENRETCKSTSKGRMSEPTRLAMWPWDSWFGFLSLMCVTSSGDACVFYVFL